MTGGDLNPGYFINPPAFTYAIAAWLSLLHPGADVQQWFADDPGRVFLDARLLSLLLGVGGVAATYAAGRAWFDRATGLLAAGVMAVACLPVFYSRLALNDAPAVLPCALGLWASAIVLRTGSLRAYAAGGACVGLAAGTKYSDGVIVVAVVAAALAGHGRGALKGLLLAAGVAALVVLVTNPYAIPDWGTFTHDLDRQRRFASGAPLIGQPERNGWWYYASTLSWALGVVPTLLAVAGGVLLLVRRRWAEALVLGSLVVLFWLYMGSQHRFYARWMLPVYPALAILAAYACAQAAQRFGRAGVAVAAAALLVPTLVPTVRNARVLSREDTRTQTRDWLVAHVPAGTKVVFEPIAPTEWYGVTPGGGAKADPRRQWDRFNRSPAIIADLARDYPRAARAANFQGYELTLTPKLVDVYRREGYCWVVTGSTEYGRALAERRRAPRALAYYRRLAASGTVAFRTSPVKAGARLPRYQVARSFTYVAPAYERPGPAMVVYRLLDCP